jgi:uncharacterized protein YegP (UPF0339 family)
MRYEYWKSQDGKWHWHLKSSTGHVLAEGAGYATREDCQAAITLIRSAAVHAEQVNLSAGESPDQGETAEDSGRLQIA